MTNPAIWRGFVFYHRSCFFERPAVERFIDSPSNFAASLSHGLGVIRWEVRPRGEAFSFYNCLKPPQRVAFLRDGSAFQRRAQADLRIEDLRYRAAFLRLVGDLLELVVVRTGNFGL